jgi:ankyrin repeat protein
LHIAVVRCDAVAVDALLALGADANAQDEDGNAPLHVGAACGGARIAILHMLIARGADANARNNADETPLHRAIRAGDVPFAMSLIAHGAGVGAKDGAGATPLHLAVTDCCEALLGELLDRGSSNQL